MSEFESLFNPRPFVEQNGQGQIFLTDGASRTLINPRVLSEQVSERNTNPEPGVRKQLFKLVTVRQFTNVSLAQVQLAFNNNQRELAERALLAGQPIPFPQQPPQNASEIQQTYAVYVDEDLYSASPVYVFRSNSPNVKVFINSTGTAREDYTLDIAHYEFNPTAPDSTVLTRWRLLHIDGRSKLVYSLSSEQLPACFKQNYGIESINYLGGGTWSGIGITDEDRILVYGFIPRNAPQGRYKLTHRGSTRGVVYESTTPSYSFTWNRGSLKLNYRERSAEETFDPVFLIQNAVLRTNKSSKYSLTHTLRPQQNITGVGEINFEETSSNSAFYVGNTNAEINSPFQSPDFGTDKLRYSLESYVQDSNVVRVSRQNWAIQGVLKSSKQTNNFLSVHAASPTASVFIRTKHGKARGRITHPFQIKTTYGSRGISHFYYYKLWWAYGKVIDVYSFGDDTIYRRNRISNDKFPIGKFGAPFISPTYPNAIETPWEAEPPAALFTPSEGLLNFALVYNSPPITGHQGCYYYHLNPFGGELFSVDFTNPVDPITSSAGTFGLSGSFIDGGDAATRLRNAQSVYSQIIGDISGANVVPSLFIGTVSVASKDTSSRAVTSPTPEQRGLINQYVGIFPNGFDGSYVSDSFDNSNRGARLEYGFQPPSGIGVNVVTPH